MCSISFGKAWSSKKAALDKYYSFLPLCEGDVALEELIRQLIQQEQEHIEECEKMLVTK